MHPVQSLRNLTLFALPLALSSCLDLDDETTTLESQEYYVAMPRGPSSLPDKMIADSLPVVFQQGESLLTSTMILASAKDDSILYYKVIPVAGAWEHLHAQEDSACLGDALPNQVNFTAKSAIAAGDTVFIERTFYNWCAQQRIDSAQVAQLGLQGAFPDSNARLTGVDYSLSGQWVAENGKVYDLGASLDSGRLGPIQTGIPARYLNTLFLDEESNQLILRDVTLRIPSATAVVGIPLGSLATFRSRQVDTASIRLATAVSYFKWRPTLDITNELSIDTTEDNYYSGHNRRVASLENIGSCTYDASSGRLYVRLRGHHVYATVPTAEWGPHVAYAVTAGSMHTVAPMGDVIQGAPLPNPLTLDSLTATTCYGRLDYTDVEYAELEYYVGSHWEFGLPYQEGTVPQP
jgi:hypothetical protein